MGRDLKCIVSIAKCDINASDSDLEESVRKSIELSRALEQLDLKGKKVLIKPNMGAIKLDKYKSWWIYLSDPRIAETVVEILKERGCGEILLADNPAIPGVNVPASQWNWPLFKDAKGIIDSFEDFYHLMGYDRFREKYGVKVLNIEEGPYVKIPVLDGGLASRWYRFNHELNDLDLVVSISKMKNHGTAGVTLSIKNLFGLCPYPRAHYAHYEYTPIPRFPNFLVDLTKIFRPRICIIDGIVASEGSEWFGTPKEVGVIVAGSNPVSVDSVGTMIMGYDPMVDMPEPPFWGMPNYMKLAAENGEGIVDPKKIEVLGEPIESVKVEFTRRPGPWGPDIKQRKETIIPEERVEFMKKQMEQIEFYNKNKAVFVAQYLGKTIFLLDQKVEIVGKKPNGVMKEAKERFGSKKAFEGIVRVVKMEDPVII